MGVKIGRLAAGIALASAAALFPAQAGLLDEFKKRGADATDSAFGLLEETASQISLMLPVLNELGFELRAVCTSVLPPTAFLSLASKGAGSQSEVIVLEMPEGLNLVSQTIVESAASARRVQKMLSAELAIINVSLGVKPNIGISYTSARIAGGEAVTIESLDKVCSVGLE